ncbi:MAG: hypothetical protein V9G19_16625 [Tetrasphaera sp.]
MLATLAVLLLCLAIAVTVLVLVAVPARRQGRDLLTDRGEAVFVRVRTSAENAGPKAGELVSTAAASLARAVPRERRH